MEGISDIGRRVVQIIYNRTIRPHLPRKITVLNGIPVRQARLFDRTDVNQQYKQPFLSAIRNTVTDGDQVVLIAAGRGVSSVSAARQGAEVIAYEGAVNMIERAAETIQFSKVEDSIHLRHAVVGDAIELYGAMADAELIHPGSLPGCDVLVLDCEGAEKSILSGMEIRPESVIVEPHPRQDVPESAVREELDRMGYTVVSAENYDTNISKRALVAQRD